MPRPSSSCSQPSTLVSVKALSTLPYAHACGLFSPVHGAPSRTGPALSCICLPLSVHSMSPQALSKLWLAAWIVLPASQLGPLV